MTIDQSWPHRTKPRRQAPLWHEEYDAAMARLRAAEVQIAGLRTTTATALDFARLLSHDLDQANEMIADLRAMNATLRQLIDDRCTLKGGV